MKLKELPVRLILSVAAGIAATTLLSFLTHTLLHFLDYSPAPGKPMFDRNVLIIALVYHSFYAVIGAIVTASLAREKAKKAAFILGSKEAIMWLLGIVLLWKHAAPWYNLSKAALGIPLALLGGRIYLWIKDRRKARRHQDRGSVKTIPRNEKRDLAERI